LFFLQNFALFSGVLGDFGAPTPYNGEGIGQYINDAFQGHSHLLESYANVVDNIGGGVLAGYNGGGDKSNIRWTENASPLTLTGYWSPRYRQETRPASISAYLCIKY
jgi:hypothetical protein